MQSSTTTVSSNVHFTVGGKKFRKVNQGCLASPLKRMAGGWKKSKGEL